MAVTLSACSTMKIFYNLADELIAREIAFHLELDEEGEERAGRVVEDLVAWHRTRMLPLYAAYLRDLAAVAAAGEPDRSAVNRLMGEGSRIWQLTVRGATPHLAPLLVRHSTPAKREFLRQRLAERQTEHLARLEKPRDERIRQRASRVTRNFERFIGDLDDPQREIIEQYVASTMNDDARRLANRELRNRAFISFLAARPRATEIAGFLDRLVLRSHEIVDPDYESFAGARFARFEELLFRILASLTPAQRAATAEKLRDHAEDFMELSG
jgi:hypothetical protein